MLSHRSNHVHFLLELGVGFAHTPERKHLFISIVFNHLALRFVMEEVLHEADRVGVIRDHWRFALLCDQFFREFGSKCAFDHVDEGYSLSQHNRHLLYLDVHLESRSVQHKATSSLQIEPVLGDCDEEFTEGLCLELAKARILLFQDGLARGEKLGP